MLQDDLESVVSNTDVGAYSNIMVPEPSKTREESKSNLKDLVGTNFGRQQSSSGLDTIAEEDASDEENQFLQDDDFIVSDDDSDGGGDGGGDDGGNNIDRQISPRAMYNKSDFADINGKTENNDPRIRREKQEILFQLLREYPDEAKGQWNIEVPLFELKYELKRRQAYQTEKDQIFFIKNLLKMVLIGIEYGNKKIGPILELEGWANSVTSNMSQFDRCITALYRRYFKKKSMDPLVEFVWLLLGSMIMWHIQSKYLGGVPQQRNTRSPDIAPPPGQFSYTRSAPSSSQMDLSSLFKMFVKR